MMMRALIKRTNKRKEKAMTVGSFAAMKRLLVAVAVAVAVAVVLAKTRAKTRKKMRQICKSQDTEILFQLHIFSNISSFFTVRQRKMQMRRRTGMMRSLVKQARVNR